MLLGREVSCPGRQASAPNSSRGRCCCCRAFLLSNICEGEGERGFAGSCPEVGALPSCQAELQEFQRRNWAEMRAAAERNKRQLAGAGAPGHGAGKQDDVDDSDVKEHAAMVQEMAHVFNQRFAWGCCGGDRHGRRGGVRRKEGGRPLYLLLVP